MVKKKALEEAKAAYDCDLKKIEVAWIYAKQIQPVLKILGLTRAWKVKYNREWGCLTVTGNIEPYGKAAKATAQQFRVLCAELEKIHGKKLTRKALESGGDVVCLEGYASVISGDMSLRIEVNLFGESPDCKIEYEEKLVKVAIVDPACLGIEGGLK